MTIAITAKVDSLLSTIIFIFIYNNETIMEFWRSKDLYFISQGLLPDANVENQECYTCATHPYIWIFIQLYHDPCSCYCNTHKCYNECCTSPVMRCESLFPLNFVVLANIVFVLAHFAF